MKKAKKGKRVKNNLLLLLMLVKIIIRDFFTIINKHVSGNLFQNMTFFPRKFSNANDPIVKAFQLAVPIRVVNTTI